MPRYFSVISFTVNGFVSSCTNKKLCVFALLGILVFCRIGGGIIALTTYNIPDTVLIYYCEVVPESYTSFAGISGCLTAQRSQLF